MKSATKRSAELVRRAFLGDYRLVHDDDAVRHGERFLLVVGDVDGGQTEGQLNVADLLAHPAAQLGVEVRQRLVLLDAAHGQPVGDVLDDGHVEKQRIGLEHHADVAVGGRQVGDVLIADQDTPRGRHLEAGDQPKHGRLAAAAGAQQRHQFARLDGERDVVDGGHLAELFDHVLEGDGSGFAFDGHALVPCIWGRCSTWRFWRRPSWRSPMKT